MSTKTLTDRKGFNLREGMAVRKSAMPEREDQIHAAIVEFLRRQLPDCLVHHSPNGGLRTKREAAKLKWMGTLAGWPDIEIVGMGVHGFMEVKTQSGSLSPPQKAVRDAFFEMGIHWALVRSVDEAKAALRFWGVLTREVAA